MKIAIEPKAKKCKGQNAAYGFEGCGKKFVRRKYGLCDDCLTKWYRLTPEGQEKVRQATLKVTKPRKELEAMGKERKERKGLPKALELTQKAFNAYIRKRDKGLPCVSSGIPWKDDFDAGHLFSVKQYSELRFDEDNCHAQSIKDNRFNEGNFQDYAINVQTRIGRERFNNLMARAEKTKRQVKHWTLGELEEIRKTYRQKIKKL